MPGFVSEKVQVIMSESETNSTKEKFGTGDFPEDVVLNSPKNPRAAAQFPSVDR